MVDEELLKILACPWCLGDLDHRDDKLTCRQCGAVYSIVDDIPNMLIEEAELHCPKCGDMLAVTEGKAPCGRCGREWSTEERLTEFSDQGSDTEGAP